MYESQLFYDSANQNTFPIIYSPNSDNRELIELLRAKFQNGIQRISFAFHNPLNNIKTFLDNKPFFDDNDLIENQTTFSQNFTFLTQLITEFRVINCDFLACNTLQYSNWTTYYTLLNRLTNVICGASNDNTGNIQYGANWIMENTNENIRDLYFTSSIVNYASSLAAFTVGYLVYITIDDTTAYVSEVSSEVIGTPPSPWDLSIPSTVTDTNTDIIYSVTGIGNEALYARSMTSVTIPNSVLSIGDKAFLNCSALISVIIQDSVASIGDYAFYNCPALASCTIGSYVTSIGLAAFYSCSALTSVIIPDSVTSIGDYAFADCTSLTSVEIINQADITSLGADVFNLINTPPTKTVKFYNTANYAALSAIGGDIASYFTNIVYDAPPSCFNEDTKILSLNRDGHEEYIPIQNLRKGDLVKSYLHGYRKIDLIGKGWMINNIDVWNDSMYILEKTDDNGLFEDLIVTGGHALLVDQLSDQDLQNYKLNNVFDDGQPIMIDDKFLLLAGRSSLFKQIAEQKIFTYYHLILESNDDDERFGVYANGILTETPSKNQFTAHAYTLL